MLLLDLVKQEVTNDLKVRPLIKSDAQQFADLRLQALRNEGELFGVTYDSEKNLTLSDWEGRLEQSEKSTIFGLFQENKLVGIMSAKPWREDQTGQTVLWCQAYISPAYRGKGHAQKIYDARKEWSQTRYSKAICYIRDENLQSTNIHVSNGGRLIKSEMITWPGYPPSLWHFYETNLSQNAPPSLPVKTPSPAQCHIQ